MSGFEKSPSVKPTEEQTASAKQEMQRRMEIEVEQTKRRKKESRETTPAKDGYNFIPNWLNNTLSEAFRSATPVAEEKERGHSNITLAERDAQKASVNAFKEGNFNIAPLFEHRGVGVLDAESYKHIFDDILVRETAIQAVAEAIRNGKTSFEKDFEFNKFVLPLIIEDADVQDVVYEQMKVYAERGDFYRFEEIARKYAKPRADALKEINNALKEGILVKLADANFANIVEHYHHIIPQALFSEKEVQEKGKEVIAHLSKDTKNANSINKLKALLNIT